MNGLAGCPVLEVDLTLQAGVPTEISAANDRHPMHAVAEGRRPVLRKLDSIGRLFAGSGGA